MAADFFTFLGSIAWKWVFVLMGGFAVINEALGRVIGWKVSNRLYWWIALVLVFAASFSAWRDEHLARIAASPDEALRADMAEWRKRTAPRHLTEAERSALVNGLRPLGSDFAVDIDHAGEGIPETKGFALDFAEVFRSLGWSVAVNSGYFIPWTPSLFVIPYDSSSSDAADKLISILNGLGFPAAREEPSEAFLKAHDTEEKRHHHFHLRVTPRG